MNGESVARYSDQPAGRGASLPPLEEEEEEDLPSPPAFAMRSATASSAARPAHVIYGLSPASLGSPIVNGERSAAPIPLIGCATAALLLLSNAVVVVAGAVAQCATVGQFFMRMSSFRRAKPPLAMMRLNSDHRCAGVPRLSRSNEKLPPRNSADRTAPTSSLMPPDPPSTCRGGRDLKFFTVSFF